MWALQKTDGMVEGWHGDGNFARTSIMYALWKTQGVTAVNWDPSLLIGALPTGKSIRIYLKHPYGWKGALKFDRDRAKEWMHLPLDYPRINPFQQWFVVKDSIRYEIKNLLTGKKLIYTGKQLLNGLPLSLESGVSLYLEIRPL